ncbi:dTMP kinase [Arthrobacter sp. Leaf141]|uniref:dTMP kinase n=1 Tax=Arthrobacter sp. Leaf141 TaxID=1736273 RepID=UPI0009E7B21A|nr:dTMP kinase [Arthrobacter sp. Leaf141]
MSTLTAGLFIAFEGGDGAGKSTQAARLAESLESRGLTVLRTREPGGTPIGEKLRSLVLDHGHGHIDAHTEALIFAASRAAHAGQVIRPALERGTVVLTDRYIDSSVAYQGAGRNLGQDAVRTLNEWATSGLQPDLTVLLDVDPAMGRRRRTAGEAAEDRLESEADEFHSRIRDAFLALAGARPGTYLVLPAHLSVADLAARILERVEALLAGGAATPAGLPAPSQPAASPPAASPPAASLPEVSHPAASLPAASLPADVGPGDLP